VNGRRDRRGWRLGILSQQWNMHGRKCKREEKHHQKLSHGDLRAQFVQFLGLALAFRFSSDASVCSGVCRAYVVVRELGLPVGLGL
jgi:hypothetical protein